MRAPRAFWLGLLLVAATLSACAGGRGSSGFDISGENAAIGHAIDTQQCVDHQGLIICPADHSPTPVATDSPTSTPTGTPYPSTSATPTPTTPMSPTPTMSVSPTATTSVSPTPTVSVSLTPTQTPVFLPHVDTGLGDQMGVTCVQTAPAGPCTVSFVFSTYGFPPSAMFGVVARGVAPAGSWQLAPAPVTDSSAANAFRAAVPLTGPEPPSHVQFAVLVFLDSSTPLAPDFESLGETGAEYAFVTPTLSVDVERDYPPTSPTPVTLVAPQITYFGVARADDFALEPTGFDPDGRPIYLRPTGQGMFLIIEARPGSDDTPVGASGYDPSGGLPDVQMLVSRPLGDGSPAVCSGGVPATDPLRFTDSPAVVDAINDLGCRVNDGAGNPVGRAATSLACTRSDAPGGFGYGFVDTTTTIQYCVPISAPWSFPPGDTIVAARVRDTDGHVGLTQQIVVRVEALAPTPTQSPVTTPERTLTASPGGPTPLPTATVPPEVGPQITYIGITRSDYVVVAPSVFDDAGRPILDPHDGSGLVLVVEAQPGEGRVPVGSKAFSPEGDAPDLQLLISQPLGDGSAAVCDKTRPDIGGVPATDPLVFSDAPAVVDAMNDLGCRVSNGVGDPVGIQISADACTIPNALSGEFGFVDARSTIQFCLPVAAAWPFLSGETIVAARLRDTEGTLGLPREMVVRIGTPQSTPTEPSATPPSATPTPNTPPPSPTATATPLASSAGPQITYFGVARPDDVPIRPAGGDAKGRPIFVRGTGQGMYLVLEARPGVTGSPVGDQAFDPAGELPDLQLLVSRPLGNGSATVCDDVAPHFGGVPATDPIEFADTATEVDAINDLGCRVNDGAGNPVGRTTSLQACTRSDAPGSFGYGFIQFNSTIQFCLPIDTPWGFPLGDTIVAARVRDTRGSVATAQEIVVRVTGLP